MDHRSEERILRWKLPRFQNHLYDTSIIPPTRGKDLILTAWYRLMPLGVDPPFIEHPAVQKTTAVSHPQEGLSGMVKAFIILNQGYEVEKQSSRCRERHGEEHPSIRMIEKNGVCKGNTEKSMREDTGRSIGETHKIS